MNDTALSPEHLKHIAGAQKLLLWCIAGCFLFVILASITRDSEAPNGIGLMAASFASLYGITSIIAFITTILLAGRAFNSIIIGILLGLIVLVPCIGLLMLLGINQRAVMILKANGIKVGLMGADMAQFKDRG